jgi:hypothetical protein
MQQFLKAWSDIDVKHYPAGFTSVVSPDWQRRMQAELGGPMMDDAALRARLQTNFSLLERFAVALQRVAHSSYGERPEFRRTRLPASPGGEIDIEAFRITSVMKEASSVSR